MFFNKIIILGAGVIGRSYGALLSLKNDVLLIDNQEVVDNITTKGITIITDNVEKSFFPKAQVNLTELPRKTLILLVTKAHQSESAIRPILRLLCKETVILILQNGLGNEEVVKKIVNDRSQVIRGIVNSGAWEIEPGKIHLTIRETVIDAIEPADQIMQLFNDSKLPTRVSTNFKQELWQKVIFNCVVNPLTAILRVRNYQIGSPELKKIRHEVIKESLKISAAEGVYLSDNITDKIDQAIQSYTNYSSMYQDIIKGNKTEINFLNGKIVELGKKYNIPTPYNEMLYALIKFLETLLYETN